MGQIAIYGNKAVLYSESRPQGLSLITSRSQNSHMSVANTEVDVEVNAIGRGDIRLMRSILTLLADIIFALILMT